MMKRQNLKQLVHHTIALAMCAAILTTTPCTGSSAPDGNMGDGKAGTMIQILDGGESENEPGIMLPMNNQPPNTSKPDSIPED